MNCSNDSELALLFNSKTYSIAGLINSKTPMSTASLPRAYTLKPDALVRSLLKAGWSQESIAHEINSTQATVSRIFSGKHQDPRYSVVERLRELVMKVDELSSSAC